MGSVGIWQVLLILVIVLIFFGAGRLPQVMKELAKGMRHFREGFFEDEGKKAKKKTRKKK